jgi:MoxR-like ATPase
MKLPYEGKPEKRQTPEWDIDVNEPDPRLYKPDASLVNAVNVALFLQRPILLAGEPGTGKTELAWSLAWELGLDKPLIFETKSTSVARDLFYYYDAVSHFRRSQHGQSDGQSDGKSVLDFIQWNALGEAIIRSKKRKDITTFFGRDFAEFRRGRDESDESKVYEKRHVVLIDEIDKAPRDFPNDLLNEVDRKFFRIPEWSREPLPATPEKSPIVVLTSNSEKNLPDAFMRRCAFHYIHFPGEETLARIVEMKLPRYGQRRETGLVREVIELFQMLRENTERRLDKKPATAELIDWLMMLEQFEISPDLTLIAQREKVLKTISAISKSEKDQEYIHKLIAGDRMTQLIDTWKKKRSEMKSQVATDLK